MNTIIIIILVFWIIFGILYLDLNYNVYIIKMDEWLRDYEIKVMSEKRRMKRVKVESKKEKISKFNSEFPFYLTLFWGFIPFMNFVLYAFDLYELTRKEFKYSNKEENQLETIVRRSKGINSFIFKILFKLKK